MHHSADASAHAHMLKPDNATNKHIRNIYMHGEIIHKSLTQFFFRLVFCCCSFALAKWIAHILMMYQQIFFSIHFISSPCLSISSHQFEAGSSFYYLIFAWRHSNSHTIYLFIYLYLCLCSQPRLKICIFIETYWKCGLFIESEINHINKLHLIFLVFHFHWLFVWLVHCFVAVYYYCWFF